MLNFDFSQVSASVIFHRLDSIITDVNANKPLNEKKKKHELDGEGETGQFEKNCESEHSKWFATIL